MTGDNQVSKVVMTVFLILFEILTTHSTASFAFMGAPIKTKSFTEAATETKRLSFYKKFLHNRLGEKTFEFLQGVENSVYVLKNRTNLDMDNQMQVIGAYLYDNFEDLEIELSPVSFSSQSG